jgi:translocation and assembly module TamB
MIHPALRFCLYAIGLLLLFVIAAVGFLQTSAGKRLLTSELSRQLSTADDKIEISDLSGSVPLDMQLGRLQLADRDGVWLTADGVRFDWSPSTLFSGRLHVVELRADRIEIARPPASANPSESENDAPFRLPELPSSLPAITVDSIIAPNIVLGAPLVGEAAALALDGSIKTDERGDSIIANLTLVRTDEATASATLDATAGLAPERLDLTLKVRESGGIIGAIAGHDDIGDVDLSLEGSGPLASWSGRLSADVESVGTADADLGLAFADQPRLTVDGSILPSPEALTDELTALLGEQLSITADIVQPRAQALDLRKLALAADIATLDVTGAIDMDRETLSLEGRLDANDLEPLGALAGIALSGAGTAGIDLGGTLDRPKGKLALTLTEPTVDGNSASSVKTVLALTTSSSLSSDRPVFDIALDGGATDILLPGTVLPDPDIGWRARLTLPLEGDISIDEAAIETAGTQLTAHGAIHPETLEGAIDLNLDAPSLRRLTEPYGQVIEGNGQIGAAIQLSETAKSIGVDLDASFADLEGLPDGASDLVGDVASLKAKIKLDPARTLSVDDLAIDGAHLSLAGDAAIALDKGPLSGKLEATLPDLAVLERLAPSGIEGAVDLKVDLGGDVEAPTADLHLTARGLMLAGEPVDKLDVALTGSDLIRAPSGDLTIDLAARETPAALTLAFRLAGEVLNIDGVDLTAPETKIAGDLAIDLNTSLIEGTLQGQSADLGMLEPWMQQPFAGSAETKLTLTPEGGRQNASLSLSGNDISSGFARIGTIDVEALLSDIIAQPTIKAEARITSFEQGTTKLDNVTLDASGNEGALDFDLSLSGEVIETVSLDAKGAARITDGFVLGVENLQGEFAGEPLRLSAPLALQQAEDSIWLSGLDLRLGEAALEGDVEINEGTVRGRIDLAGLPLRWSEVFGGPAMTGEARAAIDMSGDVTNPTLSAELNIDGQFSDTTPSALPLEIALTALLEKGRFAAKVRGEGLTDKPIDADANFPARLSLLPFAFDLPKDGPLEGRIDADLNLARLAELLELDDQKLFGNLVTDIRLGGTLGAPSAQGPVTLDGGSYENDASGTALQDLKIDALASDQWIALKTLSASTGKQGLIASNGQLKLVPEDGFPLSVTLNLDQALLVDRDDAEARISGDVAMTGSLDEAEISGDLKVDRATIFLPDGGGPNLPEIDVTERNGRFVNPPETEGEAETSRPFDPALNLNIDLPNKIYVRGRGLESEWQGDLSIAGRASDPIITGSINIKKGYFDFLEKRFELTLGEIGFSGSSPPNPIIALEAVAEDDDFKAIIKLNGPADNPQFVLSSEPVLPDDEVLARLLFNRPLSEIGPIEAGKLALAVNKLRSSGGGFDAFGEIRNILKIDTLDVVSDQDGESRVRAGKYLNDDVYVEVERGAADETGRARVEIELLPNLSLEADTSEDANSGVGFKWKFDY